MPTDEASLLQHYTLADDYIEHVRMRRRRKNQLGFALQLCVLRYPGRLLGSGEVIPEEDLNFIGAQLGITGNALLTYAARRQTRQKHLVALRRIYGYQVFAGKGLSAASGILSDQRARHCRNEDRRRARQASWTIASPSRADEGVSDTVCIDRPSIRATHRKFGKRASRGRVGEFTKQGRSAERQQILGFSSQRRSDR